MGAGHIRQLVRCLLYLTPEQVRLAVICGSNGKLLEGLRKKYGHSSRIQVIGYTDQVARYMEACDLLYTKPGGITSTEGGVMGVPMVHMKPIPGCETRNRQLFTQNGMRLCPPGECWPKLSKAGIWLDDPERCQRMTMASAAR